jgi:hypothetical protein
MNPRRQLLRQKPQFLYCSFVSIVLLTASLSLYFLPPRYNVPQDEYIVIEKIEHDNKKQPSKINETRLVFEANNKAQVIDWMTKNCSKK